MAYFINGEEISSDISKFELCQGTNDEEIGCVDAGKCVSLPVSECQTGNKTKQTLKTEATQISDYSGVGVKERNTEEGQNDKSLDAPETEESLGPGNDSNHPFSKKTWREDLKLVVEGKSLYVSKVVLDACSPVFSEIFEKDQTETLEISDTTFSEMVEFLCCLFAHIRKPVTMENIDSVTKLAVKYKVETLVSLCKDFIKQNAVAATSCDNLLNMLVLCRQCVLKGLEDQCLQALVEKDPSELDKIDLHDIPANIVGDIYRQKFYKYNRRLNDLASMNTTLEEERNKYKTWYLLEQMYVTHICRTVRSFGVSLETVQLEYIVCYNSIKIQTRSLYNYIIERISLRTVENVTYTGNSITMAIASIKFSEIYSTNKMVYGTLIFKNLLNVDNSKVFPFSMDLVPKRVNCVDATVPLNELSDPSNGFSKNSCGEIVIQYMWR